MRITYLTEKLILVRLVEIKQVFAWYHGDCIGNLQNDEYFIKVGWSAWAPTNTFMYRW